MATATLLSAKAASGKADPRVDEYIKQAAVFAAPILNHLRALIRAGCPGVEETIKWGRPTFVYQRKMLCSMAAFKAHCSLGFWQSAVAERIARDGYGRAGDSSGQFGRIASVADLPADATLRGYVAEAVSILDSGEPVKGRSASRARRPEIPVPEDFAALLEQHPAAEAAFAKFSPSHRREYLEWIVGAKREETRARRMATAVEWLAQGRTREWKYQ